MSDADPIAELLGAVARRDRVAFRDLYARASAKLFGVLLRILGNRAEAEDALQETFTRIWLRADRYDPARARAMTWMIAIARNHAIDRVRVRTAPQAPAEEADLLPDTRPDPEASAVAGGEAARIARCFERLERDRATAVRAAYMEGWTYRELADRFGVPLNTMRTWLRRSLQKLRECLDE